MNTTQEHHRRTLHMNTTQEHYKRIQCNFILRNLAVSISGSVVIKFLLHVNTTSHPPPPTHK